MSSDPVLVCLLYGCVYETGSYCVRCGRERPPAPLGRCPLEGLARSSAFTLTGTWGDGAQKLFDDATSSECDAIIVFGNRRLFGIDWWAERQRFRVKGTTYEIGQVDGEVQFDASFDPTGEVTIERAAWWRRWGYAIVRRLPVWRTPEVTE